MKVVAAYLLALLGGNPSPSEVDIKLGCEADDDRIELLLNELKGKDIVELIASGKEKLASVPGVGAGGGGGAVAIPSSGGGAAPLASEDKEEKKEEKKEPEEESDDDMGFSLFD